MAKSKKKSRLSVLRSILGPAGQENKFAKLIGRSVSWVKQASCNPLKIKITDSLALHISSVTGICPIWLVQEGRNDFPITVDGKPFTIETFEQTRPKPIQWGEAAKDVEDAFLDYFVLNQARILERVARSANAKGEFLVFLRSVESFFAALDRDFKMAEAGLGSSHLEDLEGCRLNDFYLAAKAHQNETTKSRLNFIYLRIGERLFHMGETDPIAQRAFEQYRSEEPPPSTSEDASRHPIYGTLLTDISEILAIEEQNPKARRARDSRPSDLMSRQLSPERQSGGI